MPFAYRGDWVLQRLRGLSSGPNIEVRTAFSKAFSLTPVTAR